ncbi:hypothetical protein L9F63_017195, partial [Diploptera punctata]
GYFKRIKGFHLSRQPARDVAELFVLQMSPQEMEHQRMMPSIIEHRICFFMYIRLIVVSLPLESEVYVQSSLIVKDILQS